MITPTTLPGAAIAARPITTAESIPPLNPTTIPPERASATRSFIHSAISLAVLTVPARPSCLAALDDAQECVDERGIELVSALPVDLRDGFVHRPGVLVGAFLREGVEHVRHRDHATGQRD